MLLYAAIAPTPAESSPPRPRKPIMPLHASRPNSALGMKPWSSFCSCNELMPLHPDLTLAVRRRRSSFGHIKVNGLHLYSAFIQSALQFMPLIHPFTHTFTHQRRLAAMQGTNQLVRSNWGLGVLLRDTSTRPGWDRTSDCQTTALTS